MKWQERNHFSSMVGVAVVLGGAVHFLRLLSLCLTWISRGFVSWLEAPLCARRSHTHLYCERRPSMIY